MRDGLAILTALTVCACGHARSEPKHVEQTRERGSVSPCERLAAHVMSLPDYWDNLAALDEPVIGHLATALLFENECGQISEKSRECMYEATSARTLLGECPARGYSLESFEPYLNYSSAWFDGPDEELDCGALVEHWLELSMRLMSSENRKRASRFGVPERLQGGCHASRRVEGCALESRTLVEWVECGPIGFHNRVIVEEVENYAERICACTDGACAEAVHAEFEQWMKDNRDAKGTRGDEDRLMDSIARYMECYQKLVVR